MSGPLCEPDTMSLPPKLGETFFGEFDDGFYGFILRHVGGVNFNGIAGLFDPADKWLNLKPSDEDLGQLVGYYDVGYGFPLVLPILGQSSLRDGIGLVPNFMLNPIYHAADYPTFMAASAGDKFNYLSLHGEDYEKIKNEALDPYTFIRDAHKQNREKKIKE